MNDYNSKKIKILIVEDSEDFKNLLRDFLTKQGIEVVNTSNGKEALKILDNTQLDLVLSDIRMPEMDGVVLLKKIKEKQPSLPVILMTGFSHILETETAHSLGASDFISKPFDLKDLLLIIKKNTGTKDSKDPSQPSQQKTFSRYILLFFHTHR